MRLENDSDSKGNTAKGEHSVRYSNANVVCRGCRGITLCLVKTATTVGAPLRHGSNLSSGCMAASLPMGQNREGPDGNHFCQIMTALLSLRQRVNL